MEKPGHFKRPATLLENKRYFLKLPDGSWSIPRFIQVTFVGYTPCPVVVIVQDGKRRYLRCRREDLFCTHTSA